MLSWVIKRAKVPHLSGAESWEPGDKSREGSPGKNICLIAPAKQRAF
jgi:hypothetical protein